ncbi:MAG: AzlC family ABC transporter permease [Thiopseudomonas sp.]|nr:AzlC family ABC transporter permease [Thiopseudomonas sp.]
MIKSFKRAALDAGALWLSMFVLGSGLGVMVASSGLPLWVAPLLSGSVYAGSVEFLLVGLLAVAAPLSTIAMTTLLVNSRHLFYGLSFPLQKVRGLGKLYSIFALTDEAFALTATREPRQLNHGWILCSQIGLQLCWISGSITGALIGSTLLQDVRGLDFILTALFITLAMDAYRHNPDRSTLLSAATLGILASLLASQHMLVVAMTAFAIFLMVRYRFDQRKRPAAQDNSHV